MATGFGDPWADAAVVMDNRPDPADLRILMRAVVEHDLRGKIWFTYLPENSAKVPRNRRALLKTMFNVNPEAIAILTLGQRAAGFFYGGVHPLPTYRNTIIGSFTLFSQYSIEFMVDRERLEPLHAGLKWIERHVP